MSVNADTAVIQDGDGQEPNSRDPVVEAPNLAIAVRTEIIGKPRRGKKTAEVSREIDSCPKNTADSPLESSAVGTEDEQAEDPSRSSQNAISTSYRLSEPHSRVVQ